jgi:hypothetical protein
VRVGLEAVREAGTPGGVTGTCPSEDDVLEADNVNADERHSSTPLRVLHCTNEEGDEETHSQEITEELRRAFLQMASSDVLPSPVMTSVRPEDADDPGATGTTTGDVPASPGVHERTARRSQFLRKELADKALQSAEKFLAVRTLSSLEPAQPDTLGDFVLPPYKAPVGIEQRNSVTPSLDTSVSPMNDGLSTAGAKQSFLDGIISGSDDESPQKTPMRTLRFDESDVQDCKQPPRLPESSNLPAAAPRQDQKANGTVTDTVEATNLQKCTGGFGHRSDGPGADEDEATGKTERAVQHVEPAPRTPVWPVRKLRNNREDDTMPSQAAATPTIVVHDANGVQAATRATALKRLQARLLPIVKQGEELERTRDFSAAIVKYQQALNEFRREGVSRPKLAEKLATAERRLEEQRVQKEQRRQKVAKQKDTIADSGQPAEGPHTVEQMASKVGGLEAEAAQTMAKKKKKKNKKKKQKRNKNIDAEITQQPQDSELESPSTSVPMDNPPSCQSKRAAEQVLQLQQDHNSSSGQQHSWWQSRGPVVVAFVLAVIVGAAVYVMMSCDIVAVEDSIRSNAFEHGEMYTNRSTVDGAHQQMDRERQDADHGQRELQAEREKRKRKQAELKRRKQRERESQQAERSKRQREQAEQEQKKLQRAQRENRLREQAEVEQREKERQRAERQRKEAEQAELEQRERKKLREKQQRDLVEQQQEARAQVIAATESAPKRVAAKVERERIATSAPQLTHSGCECLPVTYYYADTTVQVWTGCGSQGWCDVTPGCEQAQEAEISENNAYHGWDFCDHWADTTA